MIIANPFHLEELVEHMFCVSRDRDGEGRADGEGWRKGGGGGGGQGRPVRHHRLRPKLGGVVPNCVIKHEIILTETWI